MAYATRSDITIPLRHMPQIPPAPAVLGEIFERPRKLLPHREGSAAPEGFTDPVLQGPTAQAGAPTTGANFEGVGNVNGVLPPDPSGDIGPNHYVQTVNLSFAIWNRSGGLLYGPVANKTLWQGFGGPCQTENDGDPIVLYDHLADRWLLGQFALPNYPLGPFYQCIAVSQTGDPTGAWHRYEFLMSQNKLNDYPKFGVWPDGYYMSINQFQCNVVGCNWGGQGAVVFERTAMLSGAAARMVYFDLFSTDPNLGGMLPADLDGATLPPAGALNSFLQVDDNAWGYSGDQLQIWQFSANWASPSSSTFTHLADLGTSAFDSNLCGYSRNCIPQPGTPRKVDAISDRLMYRLQYRHFGTHQSLLVNHTVDVNGSDRAGIRWYELRKSGGGWGIFQQGTYSPDSIHRWMGSIAMNSLGDIALGYSKSSSSVFPSIYATGRLAGDAPGQMTQAEIPIVDGGGSQTHTSGRWGDYSQMTVDATDDCTFWYTQEYYAVSGNAPWRTRVGSFKLRDCGPPPPPPAVHDVAVASVTAPSPVFVSTAQTVTVGVSNQGNQSETFTVSLADSLAATISSAQGITLAPGVSTTLNFSWTPNVTGSHVLTGTASTVPDETDTADNSGSAISLVNATVHDVAVTSISAPSPVFQGDTVNISVTAKNEGSFSESFNVTVTDTGGTTAGTVSPPQPVNLGSGASQVLTFTWNTTNAST
ncbi:MAG: CARDB domain-containing protein, partial [Terriglobia bacterium]